MGALTLELIDVEPVLTSTTHPSKGVALRVAVAAGFPLNLTCHSPPSNPLPTTTLVYLMLIDGIVITEKIRDGKSGI